LWITERADGSAPSVRKRMGNIDPEATFECSLRDGRS
jgi:hypothetical protein